MSVRPFGSKAAILVFMRLRATRGRYRPLGIVTATSLESHIFTPVGAKNCNT
jgi:hypothetical protein